MSDFPVPVPLQCLGRVDVEGGDRAPAGDPVRRALITRALLAGAVYS